MLKQIHTMFQIPMYSFEFEEHEHHKDDCLDYLNNEEVYKDYSPDPHINLSGPNLHKQEMFRPYYYFFMNCFDFVMEDLGYSQKQSITSMWATKQNAMNYHHPHKHSNTFLAGVFYFHGEGAQGTSWFNPDNLFMIMPDRDLNKNLKLNQSFYHPFNEGTFNVFPAWVLHSTPMHTSKEPRFILGVNSMPVGKTRDEVYDRFYYPDANERNLDMNPNEVRRYNTKKEI